MPATRYLLRLYRHYRKVREVQENLDPGDTTRLRELLEREVLAEAGTLRLDLAQGWRLTVVVISGYPTVAQVTVDRSGRTVVRR
jgi:hypothetical protein